MHAKKVQHPIRTKRIVLPNKEALTSLSERFGIAETTIQNYLNVSNNRTAQKAIDVQVVAINQFGGQLCESQTLDYSIEIYDDDHTLLYELT